MNDSTRPNDAASIDAADRFIAKNAPKPGSVLLDGAELRRLRHARLMSQQELADHCEDRRYRVSLPTIKRAELGRRVRFRVARELARCFDVPVLQILRAIPA
ncbi:helix-turn-helix transcriptional regulator [Lysobacter hankyongensis]|uniref:HTH cro/C1-type domain-containing protein n=1 Tax=Lysobacter hankyongensis TaxID=1176535 RepID=A0ABP9BLN5_9GAMM